MFDHVKFGVSDYEKSKTFFLEALRPLGVELVDEGAPDYGNRRQRFLPGIFRGVNANHHQTLRLVLCGPLPHMGERMLAINAVPRPEINQYNLSP